MGTVLLLLLMTCHCASAQQLDNVVVQWQNLAQDAVRTYGISNQISARIYGLVGLAQHRAILSAKNNSAHASAVNGSGVNPEVAAAYAGHTVLSSLFPWKQSSVYDGALAMQLQAANLTPSQQDAAEAAGVTENVQLVKARAGEASRYARFQPAPPNSTFQYQYTPNQTYVLYPQLADDPPFVWNFEALNQLAYNKDLALGPIFEPPRNDSRNEYNTTFLMGAQGSPARTQYDTDSAHFWEDGNTTSAIGGHWASIALQVLPSNYTTEETALFFARFGSSMYDASIACYKVKYSTLYWRPITAFREGYPGFAPVPDWTPELSTPPEPEYPSGHLCTVGAAMEVLIQTLGTDQVNFTIGTEGDATLAPRNYSSLTEAANEVGDSRVFGGVHFNSSSVDGLELGRLVARGNYAAVTSQI